MSPEPGDRELVVLPYKVSKVTAAERYGYVDLRAEEGPGSPGVLMSLEQAQVFAPGEAVELVLRRPTQ